MYCPKCKCEYRAGYKVCSDCGIKLVEELSKTEMKNSNENIKSYIGIYWTAWFVLTAIIFYTKFVYIGKMNDFPVEILIIYAVVLWIPIMFLNEYEAKRLINYLKNNFSLETNKFKNNFGIYKVRPLLSFLSKNSLNDNLLNKLSENYKRFYIFTLFVFFSLPILWFILMF